MLCRDSRLGRLTELSCHPIIMGAILRFWFTFWARHKLFSCFTLQSSKPNRVSAESAWITLQYISVHIAALSSTVWPQAQLQANVVQIWLIILGELGWILLVEKGTNRNNDPSTPLPIIGLSCTVYTQSIHFYSRQTDTISRNNSRNVIFTSRFFSVSSKIIFISQWRAELWN